MDEQKLRAEFEDALAAYWEIGYQEGERGISKGDEANEALHRVRKAFVAALSQPAAAVRPVLVDVEAERVRQDAKWGGPNHDDGHEVADFVQLIEDYSGWARTMAGMGSYGKARNRLIQVAALASACCESLDRASPKATP